MIDFKHNEDSSRSKFNQFLEQCPKWVQDEVWGENGLRAQIDELKERLADALDTCPECTSGLTKIKGNIRKCHHCGVESDANE